MTGDAVDTRPGEELPHARLVEYLRGVISGISNDLVVEQFPGGHSNLTYLLRTPTQEFVLRRPPMGPVAPKAHDMVREFHVLEAVHPHFSPAPRVLHLALDLSIIGVPFYLMERRHGVVVRHQIPPEYAGTAHATQRMSAALIEGLSQLHAIDIVATGLIHLGKPAGFLERQLLGWTERWRRALTTAIPAATSVVEWLNATLPVSPAATIVHNDYKLDNVMFAAADPGRLVAVLDWEMTTVGDPLADLGMTLSYWCLDENLQVGGGVARGDWWNREQMLERYVARTGLDVGRIEWYEVFGMFKLAVILQQIYARYLKGQTLDQRFQSFGDKVESLMRSADALRAR